LCRPLGLQVGRAKALHYIIGRPEGLRYIWRSNGHSPARRARHKYAAVPAAITPAPDATYFHPLVVMTKIHPPNAIMLGSG
jgi:hypothetical protein